MKNANAVAMLTLSALIAFPAISRAVTNLAMYVNGLQVAVNVGGGVSQSNPGESGLDQDSSSPLYDLCVIQQCKIGGHKYVFFWCRIQVARTLIPNQTIMIASVLPSLPKHLPASMEPVSAIHSVPPPCNPMTTRW